MQMRLCQVGNDLKCARALWNGDGFMERGGQVEEKGSGSGRELVYCGMQKLRNS